MSPKSTKKQSTSPPTALPQAPIVYINDPTEDLRYAHYLRDLIPNCTCIPLPDKELLNNSFGTELDTLSVKVAAGSPDDGIVLLCESGPDSKPAEKINTVKLFREEAIKHGRNFASVNLSSMESVTSGSKLDWGTNHLEMHLRGQSTEEVANKVYHWLFNAFTVKETLHLIPDSEMRAVDKAFPEYEYCTIADNKAKSKNAKVQFVALIISRPVVKGQTLSWSVADKTGTANFYFQYRGEASKYTWDWCLALKVGDRRALPRMPMVEIKERKRVRVAKAPIRTVAAAVSGVGHAVRAVGHGIAKLGDLGKLGKSSEWVPEADVVNGKKVDWADILRKESAEKSLRAGKVHKQVYPKVFNEKGEKVWADDDSVASTTAGGDEVFEEKVKDFV
ncbi:hypothetical protein PV11_05978 [Exophiala sideris]|uniref:Uncharacterized protein n=1 Tax=Exophiala sideris TaxID=1016849 RepID=A0A0D1ZB98_9EURO|nr:hypothetical protein PV11_05978 [Exophiala sideris]